MRLNGKDMKRREFLLKLALGSVPFLLPQCKIFSGKKKTNFVVILIDDLGWRDLGCYGSTFYETPNIDQLAARGVRFTDAYAAAPVCSPTRASIITGKHPVRLLLTDFIGRKEQQKKLITPAYLPFLETEEVTIAEMLKGAGYAAALIGKWHLGYQPFYPEKQGFDVNIGGHESGHPASYFYPYKDKEDDYWDVPGLENGEPGEYLTDRLTNEAIKFIKKNRHHPFFLFLSHYALHSPLEAKKEKIKKYQKKITEINRNKNGFTKEKDGFTKTAQDNAIYAAMLESVDESVGNIVQTLESHNLLKNTVIILTSDNGGFSTLKGETWAPTSNLPLRAGKGWLYEGGIRVPLIINWHGAVGNSSVCTTPVFSTDLYPTMLEIAGQKKSEQQFADGESLVPLLTNQGQFHRDALYWHYPHYHPSGGRPASAIRVGDYKLIEWFEDDSLELYNLKDDIGEKNNLVKQMPQKSAQLKQMLDEWREKMGARLPVENPEGKENLK